MVAALAFLAPRAAAAPENTSQYPIVADKAYYVEMADRIAKDYGLNRGLFVKVLECESRFKPDALGDGGTSYGIAQLHKPISDWKIPISTAYNPEASMHIMANAWVRGEAKRWTCYRMWRDHYL